MFLRCLAWRQPLAFRVEQRNIVILHHLTWVRIVVFTAILVVSTCSASHAIDLRATLDYARQHAPTVDVRQAERARVRADARARGFWLPASPSVSAEWTERQAQGSTINDRVLEGSLALPLGQGVFRARAGSAQRRVGLQEVDALAREWAAEVAWRYYEHLRWRWLHEKTLRQAEIMRRLVEVVQRRVQAGDASGLELDLGRVEAAEGTRRAFESERGLRQAEEQLGSAIGWPIGTSLSEPDSLELIPAFPDTVQLLATALRRRPDLLVARAALDLGKAEARLANAHLLPEAELGVFAGQDDGDDIQGLRLGLSVPFLGPAIAERGARAAERQRLEAQLRVAVRDAHAQVAVAQQGATLAFREVSLFQQEILPRIQESRARNKRAYAVGEVDLTSVLLSEQRYREVERSFALALGAYIDALRELEVASGLPVLSGYELSQEVRP